MTYLEENWLIVLIALAAAVVIAWYIFHATRRTRVTTRKGDVLDEGAAPAARNQALIDAPAAAVGETPLPPLTPGGLAGTGVAVAAFAEEASLDAARASGEDAGSVGSELGRLKGVGPKLVARLQDLGVTRLEQVAAWSGADVDRIDAQLDRFAGRIRRDDWIGQARLLTAGDVAGFAEKYGNVN